MIRMRQLVHLNFTPGELALIRGTPQSSNIGGVKVLNAQSNQDDTLQAMQNNYTTDVKHTGKNLYTDLGDRRIINRQN